MRPQIEALLEDIASAADRIHPGWMEGWQPGLTRAQIDAALAPLGDWRPPEEIIALYEWRNGQAGDEGSCIWVPFGVLPLEPAVSLFKQLHDAIPQLPPLFAFGYGSKTNLEVPLSREPRESEPLYHRDNEGSPFLAFTGLEGLLRTSLEAFQKGLFSWHEEFKFWQSAEEGADGRIDQEARAAIHALRLRHNPGTSPTLWDEQNEECGRLWISSFDASTWPREWQDYIGFDAEGFQPQGATATITDLALGRVDWKSPVIVHSIVEGLVGGGKETRVRLGDGVQTIEVICEGVHASGVVLGDRFEFELERPLTKKEHAARRREDRETDKAVREQMKRIAEVIAKETGRKPSKNELQFSDFVSTLGGADTPIFVARRVALVERDPEPDDIADDFDATIFRNAGRGEAAEDVPGLAEGLLQSYHAGYRIEHKFKEVSLDQIPEIDMDLYERIDAELVKSGFRILGAYEIANMREVYPGMPRIAMRTYSDGESIMGAFYSLPKRMWASMSPPRKPPAHGIVDLLTQFDDGLVFLTSSAGDALKYDAPPSVDRVMLPIGATLQEVLTRHRARIAKASRKPVTATTMKDYLRLLRGRRKAECEFALNRVPTVDELVRLGTNKDLARRINKAMQKLL